MDVRGTPVFEAKLTPDRTIGSLDGSVRGEPWAGPHGTVVRLVMVGYPPMRRTQVGFDLDKPSLVLIEDAANLIRFVFHPQFSGQVFDSPGSAT